MSGKAQIAHTMPGRVRIRVPAARGRPDLLEQTRALFDGVAGMWKVTIKPDSASIVLHYDPERAAAFEADLWQRWAAAYPAAPPKARSHGPLPGDEFGDVARKLEARAEQLAERSQAAQVLVQLFKDADRQVKLATNNLVGLRVVLALGLAAATFVWIGAQAATPMWVTLVLFALNHFLELQPTAAPARA